MPANKVPRTVTARFIHRAIFRDRSGKSALANAIQVHNTCALTRVISFDDAIEHVGKSPRDMCCRRLNTNSNW
jgi:hypothetical protein